MSGNQGILYMNVRGAERLSVRFTHLVTMIKEEPARAWSEKTPRRTTSLSVPPCQWTGNMKAELPQAVLRRTMDFAQLRWQFFEEHEKYFE